MHRSFHVGSWLQAFRPLAQFNIAPPVLYGQAVAYGHAGVLSLEWLAWAIGLGLLIQAIIVFSNDAADAALDPQNDGASAFAGGSRVIPQGRLTSGQLLAGAVVAAVLMFVAALYLALWAARPWLFVPLLSGLLLVWCYEAPPLKLSYRGHGELLQGLGMGVVLPWIGYYLQSGSLGVPLWALVGPTLIGVAGNVLTALPDAPADAVGGKRTLPVRVGETRAQWVAAALILLGAVGGGGALMLGMAASRGGHALTARGVLLSTACALIPLGLSLGYVRRTRLSRQRQRLRFVALGLAASVILLFAWSVLLVT